MVQELDRWLRERAVENVATSAATLQSLAALLGRIENLVINDDIGKQVLFLPSSSSGFVQGFENGQLDTFIYRPTVVSIRV